MHTSQIIKFLPWDSQFFGINIGLVKSGEIPLKLARSIWTENEEQIIKHDALDLVSEWYKVRKNLYLLLLLNPEEFSAKCMLTEAIESARNKAVKALNWYDTDYELLEKLRTVSSANSLIISRLVKGDLYGCLAIYSASNLDSYEQLVELAEKKRIEAGLSNLIRSKFKTYYNPKTEMIGLQLKT